MHRRSDVVGQGVTREGAISGIRHGDGDLAAPTPDLRNDALVCILRHDLADDLFELGAGDDIASDRVENVVEARSCAGFIPHRSEELQRVRYPPARRGVDDDELAAERRDLADVAVPVEQPVVEAADLLDERYAPVQARIIDDAADGADACSNGSRLAGRAAAS